MRIYVPSACISDSSDSGGGIGGPGMAYLPVIQLPRSTSRQRLEQKGKDLCWAIVEN